MAGHGIDYQPFLNSSAFNSYSCGLTRFLLLACHKKSYLICIKFLKNHVIFIYFQAAVSALLAVSVLYVEKIEINTYVIFQKFE